MHDSASFCKFCHKCSLNIIYCLHYITYKSDQIKQGSAYLSVDVTGSWNIVLISTL